MTTATVAVGNRTMDTGMARPRRSLEELVDRLIEAMFGAETAEPSATQTIHEARRLRQAGDVDGGLAILAGMDMAKAETREARWAFSEWSQMVKRGFGDRGRWSTARALGGPPPWFPTATGCLRWSRSWGCAGGPARCSRGAACGVCGPPYRVRGRL